MILLEGHFPRDSAVLLFVMLICFDELFDSDSVDHWAFFSIAIYKGSSEVIEILVSLQNSYQGALLTA